MPRGYQYQYNTQDKRLLLFHARMFVIGDRYEVVKLRHLALFCVHRILEQMIYDQEPWWAYIVPLLSYCYEEPTPEPLRKIVLDFLDRNMELLRDTPEVVEGVMKYGQLIWKPNQAEVRVKWRVL
jgi:hypothetical protein